MPLGFVQNCLSKLVQSNCTLCSFLNALCVLTDLLTDDMMMMAEEVV